MFNIYICDKNLSSQRKLSTVIGDIAHKKLLDIKIATFQSGEDLLAGKPELADIICMDVVLDGALNGIETAKELRRRRCCAEIIFVATNGEYVFEAYDICPIPLQYLIKDKITAEKFESVFSRAISMVQKKRQELFTFKFQGKKVSIPFRDISHFTIINGVVFVFYTEKKLDFKSSLLLLQKQLPEKIFIRTHRSHIINLKYISFIRHRSVVLTTGQEIPIGKTYAKSVEHEFSRYLEDSHAIKI